MTAMCIIEGCMPKIKPYIKLQRELSDITILKDDKMKLDYIWSAYEILADHDKRDSKTKINMLLVDIALRNLICDNIELTHELVFKIYDDLTKRTRLLLSDLCNTDNLRIAKFNEIIKNYNKLSYWIKTDILGIYADSVYVEKNDETYPYINTIERINFLNNILMITYKNIDGNEFNICQLINTFMDTDNLTHFCDIFFLIKILDTYRRFCFSIYKDKKNLFIDDFFKNIVNTKKFNNYVAHAITMMINSKINPTDIMDVIDVTYNFDHDNYLFMESYFDEFITRLIHRPNVDQQTNIQNHELINPCLELHILNPIQKYNKEFTNIIHSYIRDVEISQRLKCFYHKSNTVLSSEKYKHTDHVDPSKCNFVIIRDQCLDIEKYDPPTEISKYTESIASLYESYLPKRKIIFDYNQTKCIIKLTRYDKISYSLICNFWQMIILTTLSKGRKLMTFDELQKITKMKELTLLDVLKNLIDRGIILQKSDNTVIVFYLNDNVSFATPINDIA